MVGRGERETAIRGCSGSAGLWLNEGFESKDGTERKMPGKRPLLICTEKQFA